MATNSRIENSGVIGTMVIENLGVIEMMEIEIIVMEITSLVVTEMSNLEIVKGAIARVATNSMTRKDSMTESRVILFHQEIGSNSLRNFRYQYPIQKLHTPGGISNSETIIRRYVISSSTTFKNSNLFNLFVYFCLP